MPIPVTSSISHIFHTPSKSLADRLFSAEFDDALVDQIAWKNLRYDGCKITSKKINEFNTQEVASLSGEGYSYINQPGQIFFASLLGQPQELQGKYQTWCRDQRSFLVL